MNISILNFYVEDFRFKTPSLPHLGPLHRDPCSILPISMSRMCIICIINGLQYFLLPKLNISKNLFMIWNILHHKKSSKNFLKIFCL